MPIHLAAAKWQSIPLFELQEIIEEQHKEVIQIKSTLSKTARHISFLDVAQGVI